MRAKLKIETILQTEYGEDITLKAVCKTGSYPDSGHDEDNSFAKFTPTAELKLSVRNPDLFGKFKPGQTFYLDFTPAE